jgi:hypothetical protein
MVETRGLSDGEEPSGKVAPGGRAYGETIDTTLGGDATVADPMNVSDAGSDAAVVLLDDEFELGTDCDGWRPGNATAVPAAGGYQSPRACLICRSGDMFVDKDVALPFIGPVTFEVRAKRASTATEAGTSFYAMQIFLEGTAYIGNDSAVHALDDTWTNVKLTLVPPATSTAVRLRIRLASGCVLVDDVRVTLTHL